MKLGLLMASRDSHRKPTFFWQAALIVCPVMVLAAVGFLSLRQDRLLAKKDAEERAQSLADELAVRVWQSLSASNRHDHSFRADTDGNLVFPPPVVELPSPKPLPLTDLSPEQLGLWNNLKQTEYRGENRTNIEIYEQFLESAAPDNFKAVAEYGLGLALASSGKSHEAVEAFSDVVERFPTSHGETGLPLRPLAQLKILERTSFGFGYYDPTNQPFRPARRIKRENYVSDRVFHAIPYTNPAVTLEPPLSPESFCSNVIYYPSPLSPFFLDSIAERLANLTSSEERVLRKIHRQRPTIKDWQDLWREHELCREFFRGARAQLTNAPLAFWLDANGDEWLAIRSHENGAANWYICRSKSEVISQLDSLIAQKSWPDYLAVAFELAGRTFMPVNYTGEGHRVVKHSLSDLPASTLGTNTPSAALLGSAARSVASSDLVRANVYLTNPDQLFKRQTARTFWFGSLIAVSAIAALIGLWTAWSAFHSQRRLSEMKNNFVSSVSHELRAPIASVRLLAESLEKGKIQEPRKQVEYFRFIGQECRRLSGLIQNVLDFSRIEQGRKQYDFEPTDMTALVRETVGLMHTYAAEKDVSLCLNNDGASTVNQKLELSVDSRAIQQALINLIDNAIKHSPKGSEVDVGLIQNVRTEPAPGDNGTCSIWIEDKGPGIPLEEHEKIFERFYRVGSELRRETQGVGIGLSIVKHVVEAHGGDVRVKSAPGQGSRFTIELPNTK